MSWSIPLRGATGLPTHGGGPGSSQLSSHEFKRERTSVDVGGHSTPSGQQIWTLRNVPGHSGNTPKCRDRDPGGHQEFWSTNGRYFGQNLNHYPQVKKSRHLASDRFRAEQASSQASSFRNSVRRSGSNRCLRSNMTPMLNGVTSDQSHVAVGSLDLSFLNLN